MRKEFRPLILEPVENYPEFVNCYEIITITHCPLEDWYVVDVTSKVGIAISNKAAKALMEALTTDLFFSDDDIDERKVLRSDGTFARFLALSN
jgi:hypothetical protein